MDLAAELSAIILPASPQIDVHIHQVLKSLSRRVAGNYGASDCVFYISSAIGLN